jgi:hypothetical protein
MAGDWIKMRIDLQSHPKVVRIMSATGADKFRVIGGLHAVWSVFDTHSVNGILNGYSLDLMDQVVGWPGLSVAVASVGWLQQTPESLVMPEFQEHNGKSGKRRAEDQKRKRESRKSPEEAGQVADKKRTREEKRRDKESIKKSFVPPSQQDVINYFSENGYTKESGLKAFNYYATAEWKDSQGKPVKNWKQKMQGVWFKPENKIAPTVKATGAAYQPYQEAV